MDELTFSSDDFIDLQNDIQTFISPDLSEQQITIDSIITIGQKLLTTINSLVNRVQYKNGNIGGFDSVKNYDQEGDYVRDVFLMGAEYLFKVRQFFLNDVIHFSSGVTYVDEHNTQRLGERKFDQNEMFQNHLLRGSISRAAVVFNNNLKQVEIEETSNNLSLLWSEILEWSTVKKKDKPDGTEPRSDGKGVTEWFKKDTPDTFIYYRYAGNHVPMRYYKERNQHFFNTGWLYEWLKSEQAARNLNKLNTAMHSNGNHPLEPLIIGNSRYGLSGHKMDNVAGIKGGDYNLGSRSAAYSEQAKYGNEQVITFTSIIKNIEELNHLFIQLRSDNNTKAIAKEIMAMFTDETTLKGLGAAAKTTINRITKILSQTK